MPCFTFQGGAGPVFISVSIQSLSANQENSQSDSFLRLQEEGVVVVAHYQVVVAVEGRHHWEEVEEAHSNHSQDPVCRIQERHKLKLHRRKQTQDQGYL